MSKLTEHADKEYDIIRDYIKAINSVDSSSLDKTLKLFSEEIQSDLRRVLELHYDKNSLKKKYYHERKKTKV